MNQTPSAAQGGRHSSGNMTYVIKAEDTPTLKRGLAEALTEKNEELSMLAAAQFV